ncbi:hypothetical protein UCMB321_0555 [Pseudomonas batumici]|uniref:Uncharacterized protein n=1 Tax=Pseudomonas batumici TaxID=226910 RepID=A0A0C2I920_9PSED|nr:hypothetical protein UCMB321_0555 [Pseudomonas batumici]
MTDNRANMQNHQDRQNNAGNIMDFFENSDESGTFNGGGYQEQVK